MKKVNQLFKKLFSFNEEEKGIGEIEILKVEKRIGVTLPKRIRNFYINQVKNQLINSCHNFERPENLKFNEDGWLGIYNENQGICYWAINKKYFNDENVKIFVNYENRGFEEVAKNFKDFLIIRAASECSMYIYPFRMIAQVIQNEDIKKIVQKFGEPKSDVKLDNCFRKRMFWNDENEIVKITEWDKHFYKGVKNISIVSQSKKSISDYQKLIKSDNWKISQDKIKSKTPLESYFEKKEISKNPNTKETNQTRNIKGNSLPF